MVRSLLMFLVAMSSLVSLASPGWAQSRARALSERQLEHLGLEQVWSSQIRVDATRSNVGSIKLQIIGMDSYENLQQTSQVVYELTVDGRSRLFRENDLDSLGQAIGRAEAERLAEKQKILWEARGAKPTLTMRTVPRQVLYVVTGRGTLHAMDAESGRSLWSVNVGDPRRPTLSPAANDKYVAVINGSTLILIDRVNGSPIWERPLEQSPAGSPEMSATQVFVVGIDGSMAGYDLPTAESDHRHRKPWIYPSNDSVQLAPIVTPTTVSWVTEAGRVQVASLAGPTMQYRYESPAPIHGGIAYMPPSTLVVASQNGYITAMSETSGRIEWDYSTGDTIHKTPFVTDTVTLAITSRDQLVAVANKDGAYQWTADGVAKVVASSAKRIYALDHFGNLLILDKATGARVGKLPVGGSDLSISNVLTDRLYLATSLGTLMCLRETGAVYPTIAVPLPKAPEEKTPTRRRRTTTPKPAATGDEAVDEAESDTDPFSDGDSMEEEATDDQAAEEDATDEEGAVTDEESADEVMEEEPADEATTEEDAAGEEATEEGASGDEDPFDFGS